MQNNTNTRLNTQNQSNQSRSAGISPSSRLSTGASGPFCSGAAGGSGWSACASRAGNWLVTLHNTNLQSYLFICVNKGMIYEQTSYSLTIIRIRELLAIKVLLHTRLFRPKEYFSYHTYRVSLERRTPLNFFIIRKRLFPKKFNYFKGTI